MSATDIYTSWQNCSWNSFDDYAAAVTDATLTYWDPTNPANWKGVVCLCRDFQKKGICRDAVAILCLEEKFEIPEEFKVLKYHILFHTII